MRHPFTKLMEVRDHMALLDAAMWWRGAVDEWGIQSAEAVPYAEVLRKAIDAYWNARSRERSEPPQNHQDQE